MIVRGKSMAVGIVRSRPQSSALSGQPPAESYCIADVLTKCIAECGLSAECGLHCGLRTKAQL
jgi:hypothetical protein